MDVQDPRILRLRAMREKSLGGGGPARIVRQHARGKLTARERIEQLLDRDTFHELDRFVVDQRGECEIDTEEYLGEGVVSGQGEIDGRPVYVYAQDFTIHGGTLSEMHSRRICQVLDLAAHSGTPVVGLIDSGGARIQQGVKTLGGYADIFRRNAQYSGIMPQISLVLGPCVGGAAYSPALTDCIIMVERQSFMFLTAPDVIKAVTGEEIGIEDLGGAAVHSELSGTAHLTASTEQDALQLCRRLLSYLPANHLENPPYVQPTDQPNRMEDALNAMVPLDATKPYSMHEVIERIIDLDSFLEQQPGWAQNVIVGLGRLDGYSVGLIAQEPSMMTGVLDLDAADKIARFVRFCDCFNIPLLTFVDSPGFLPGVDQEHRGVIRHAAKILYAYSEATVPKISIITRRAYGGAYIAMSSKYLGTDLNYAWPSAEVAVMGAEGAVSVLYGEQIAVADDPEAEEKRLVEEYRARFNNPYHAASMGYVDDIIEPRETRPKLIAALKTLRNKYAVRLPRKHGNMPV